ncbi:MAG: CgeB family protein [Anaerolineae bacterium]
MVQRILFIGAQWHGSDATGLCRAFRELGCAVKDVDPDTFLPSGVSMPVRAIRRLGTCLFTSEFSAEILKYARILRPQFAVVYKGSEVKPDVIIALKKLGVLVFLVYPDVSMHGHSKWIPQCIPLYDWIFTTKSFGVRDIWEQFSVQSEFLPHGFDPHIHRLMDIDADTLEQFGCDASFIGTWSPRKTQYLASVRHSLPSIKLRIWGSQWNRTRDADLLTCVEGTDILGDPYPLAIACSTINIALLSEQRAGASSGDVSTSRTFYIPASGGFMLHERTEEVMSFFREGEEIDCFGSSGELAEKVCYYLDHPEERERIRLAGHRRVVAEHGQEVRAERILTRYRQMADLQRQGDLP